jgi:hypothetical protein
MNDMDLHQTAYRLKQALDESVDRMPPDIVDDLRQRRSAALLLYTQRQTNRNSSRMAQALSIAASPLRNLAIVTALSLGLVGTYYWDQLDLANENEEIDSALLSDDLPPEIYSDSGFHTWLERSRSSSSP